jgi:hypothetical protein
MIWSCFWAGEYGPLVLIDGDMNQDLYVDCLSQTLLPWYNELPNSEDRKYIFQEDNAPCHTGSYAK